MQSFEIFFTHTSLYTHTHTCKLAYMQHERIEACLNIKLRNRTGVFSLIYKQKCAQLNDFKQKQSTHQRTHIGMHEIHIHMYLRFSAYFLCIYIGIYFCA